MALSKYDPGWMSEKTLEPNILAPAEEMNTPAVRPAMNTMEERILIKTMGKSTLVYGVHA